MCQVYLKRVFWVILQDRRQKRFGSRRDKPISGHARKQGAYSLTNNLTLLNISVACNKTSSAGLIANIYTLVDWALALLLCNSDLGPEHQQPLQY